MKVKLGKPVTGQCAEQQKIQEVTTLCQFQCNIAEIGMDNFLQLDVTNLLGLSVFVIIGYLQPNDLLLFAELYVLRLLIQLLNQCGNVARTLH